MNCLPTRLAFFTLHKSSSILSSAELGASRCQAVGPVLPRGGRQL